MWVRKGEVCLEKDAAYRKSDCLRDLSINLCISNSQTRGFRSEHAELSFGIALNSRASKSEYTGVCLLVGQAPRGRRASLIVWF